MAERSETPNDAPDTPPIGRGEHARRRVLTAALDQLAEEGASRFTMDAVAARAHASKATLYRRWPTAAALVVEAMGSTFRPIPTPDTGDTRRDLHQLLHAAVHLLTASPFPRLLAAVIDLAERDPSLAATHADLTARQRSPLLEVIIRGQRTGQIPADTDPDVLADLLAAPLFYRRFIAHQPIPAGFIDSIIDQVLAPAPLATRTE